MEPSASVPHCWALVVTCLEVDGSCPMCLHGLCIGTCNPLQASWSVYCMSRGVANTHRTFSSELPRSGCMGQVQASLVPIRPIRRTCEAHYKPLAMVFRAARRSPAAAIPTAPATEAALGPLVDLKSAPVAMPAETEHVFQRQHTEMHQLSMQSTAEIGTCWVCGLSIVTCEAPSAVECLDTLPLQRYWRMLIYTCAEGVEPVGGFPICEVAQPALRCREEEAQDAERIASSAS